MDYSFLKLYDSIEESVNDDRKKFIGYKYFVSIQLSPSEIYLQMTNYEGGLSFGGNFTCHIVDSCDNVLLDITDKIFIEEYIDVNGNTQNKIEIVNLGADYYGRAVHIRFTALDSQLKYYTRPIYISEKNIQDTYRFDYKNNSNSKDLSYTNATGVLQSIRLLVEFENYQNDSEVSEYYQISTENIVSHRPLRKLRRRFRCKNIDTFTFERLQELLFHDVIYIDTERMTNKAVLEVGDNIGRSNLLKANFNASIDSDDTYDFTFQVFKGLLLLNKVPEGVFTLATYPDALSGSFGDENVTLGDGFLRVFDASDDSVVASYGKNDINLSGADFTIPTFTGVITTEGSYYIRIGSGLFNVLGFPFQGIDNNNDWTFSIQTAVFDGSVFDSSKFLTN